MLVVLRNCGLAIATTPQSTASRSRTLISFRDIRVRLMPGLKTRPTCRKKSRTPIGLIDWKHLSFSSEPVAHHALSRQPPMKATETVIKAAARAIRRPQTASAPPCLRGQCQHFRPVGVLGDGEAHDRFGCALCTVKDAGDAPFVHHGDAIAIGQDLLHVAA